MENTSEVVMTPCEEHGKITDVLHRLDTALPLLAKDVEYLRRDQELILARFGKHVDDADRDGGWHTRIVNVENDLRNMKIMGRWFMIGSGVIGGMMGAGAPEAILGIARVLGVIH